MNFNYSKTLTQHPHVAGHEYQFKNKITSLTFSRDGNCLTISNLDTVFIYDEKYKIIDEFKVSKHIDSQDQFIR